jgi:hypothetical protein
MRPVGITLTLLILVVPSLVLSIVLLVLVFMFQVSPDAPAVLDMVSTGVSMILVSLLVWERLRDSLFRKLSYLHDIALSKLYQQFSHATLNISVTAVERARQDLTQHGRSLGLIRLYPNALLQEIDEFLSTHSQFATMFRKIEEDLKVLLRKTSVNRNLLQELLGMKQQQLSAYSQDSVWKYREACATLIEKQPNLTEQLTSHLHFMRAKRNLILEKLETFMKTNNLSLKGRD